MNPAIRTLSPKSISDRVAMLPSLVAGVGIAVGVAVAVAVAVALGVAVGVGVGVSLGVAAPNALRELAENAAKAISTAPVRTLDLVW
jgi:ribosomal protein S12 methylthiotransferase accessory factor YcaO